MRATALEHRFDVNSTKEKPSYVSDSYLSMLLSQMKQDGYSVFVVRGRFPVKPIGTAAIPNTKPEP